jgi:hypothetical protein
MKRKNRKKQGTKKGCEYAQAKVLKDKIYNDRIRYLDEDVC